MKLLYKYRSFNATTVHSLLADEMWFASPLTFNDPLDTKPRVESDFSDESLIELYKAMLMRRITAEDQAVRRAVGMTRHVRPHIPGRVAASRVFDMIQDLKYEATNPDYDHEGTQIVTTAAIEAELLGQYGNGVCSLAGKPDCPLMWSHYGEQHYGLCLGYGVTPTSKALLRDVKYGQDRIIHTSLIKRMIEGETAATEEIQDRIFCRKAQQWAYEQESRVIAKVGAQPSPFDLHCVIFGLRCPETVKFAVFSMLKDRENDETENPGGLKFLEIRNRGNGFGLTVEEWEDGEARSRFPYSHRAVMRTIDLVDQEALSND